MAHPSGDAEYACNVLGGIDMAFPREPKVGQRLGPLT